MDIQVLDVRKVCRTCLGVGKQMKCLFPNAGSSSSKESAELVKMITNCSMYPVLRDDNLPKKICTKCVNKVRKAYSFKSQCERSYELLSSVLGNCGLDTKPENIVIPAELILIDSGLVKEECDNVISGPNNPLGGEEEKVASFLDTVTKEEEEVIEHKCELCSKTFSQEVHLRKHMSTTHSTADSTCSICSEVCGSTAKLKKHYEVSHSSVIIPDALCEAVTIKCSKCLEDLDTSFDTDQHVCKGDISFDPSKVEVILGLNAPKGDKSDVENPEYDASSQFSVGGQSGGNDSAHDDSCEEEEEIPLAQLLKPKARKRRKLRAVTRNSSKQIPKKKSKKIHRCDQCGKIFSRSTHLKRHQLTHSSEKPFVCTECNKGFTRADHLALHKYNHSAVKPFVCSVCDRGFIRAIHLRRHQETRHGDKESNANRKTEFCTVCEKGFTTSKYLATHMRIHTERKWKCKFCPEVFDSKAKSTEHSKSHAHEKPFLCSECGLRFVRNDYLIIHMRRHKGEKPYKCKFCSKGFPRATDLNVHERYHTGEKSHLCTVCGKGFQRAYNLLVHTRVHTGEKPYKCPHCSKSFAQGNDLKSHIRRHTGERFKCDICEEGFIQAYHLTQHKRNVHGINTQSHIRRVEKFVTPIEQLQQMEAIRLQKVEKRETEPEIFIETIEMDDSDDEDDIKSEDSITLSSSRFEDD